MTGILLTVDAYLSGLDEASARLARSATRAGLDATVPTCPGWTVRDLVAHQGMVHRWATAVIRGESPRTIDSDAAEAEGRAHVDPVRWFEAGAWELLLALREAPGDLDVLRFLRDAPPARVFWARRQHHETTMHALDALAAREARLLTADDAWFGAAAAVDGVDELLVGFWQRPTKGPRATATPYAALVAADSGERWLLDVGTDAVRTRRLTAQEEAPDAPTLSGSAVDLYLALWNRGGSPHDPAGMIDAWRTGGAIGW